MEEALLTGRVFSSDTGKPLAGAAIAGPSGATTESDTKGGFELRYERTTKGAVQALADGYAPVKKPTPSEGGYTELMSKAYDLEEEIDAEQGATLKLPGGGSVEVPAMKLVDDLDAPIKVAKISVATPDPRKLPDLSSLPGDLDADKAGVLGKISADSPMFVSATGDDDDLLLRGGKLKLGLPTYYKGVTKAAGQTLYRFDEGSGTWREVAPLISAVDDDGNDVMIGEVASFGWYTVGTFYDRVACLRGCVVDDDGEAVAGVQAVAAGVDDFTQSRSFAAKDGCFELVVRADARLSVSVQAQAGYVAAQLVESGAGGTLDDPGACRDLGKLTLTPQEDTACPSGFAECGGRCVDVASDSEHCGACGESCGAAACVAGSCEEPQGEADAGMTSAPDSGNPPELDAGGMDAGTVQDAGSAQSDTGTPPAPDAGGPADAGVVVPDGGATAVDAGLDPNEAGTDAGFSCTGCSSHDTGGLTGVVAACCAADDVCGLEVGVLKDYGVTLPNSCLPTDVSAPDDYDCPSLNTSGVAGGAYAYGCCLDGVVCGINLSAVYLDSDAGVDTVDMGVGCVSYEAVAHDGGVQLCEPPIGQ